MSTPNEEYERRWDDPYTQEFPLCDDDGIVRRGAMHHGTDYPCTGHAHFGGEHIKCTSPAHEAVTCPSCYQTDLVRKMAEPNAGRVTHRCDRVHANGLPEFFIWPLPAPLRPVEPHNAEDQAPR